MSIIDTIASHRSIRRYRPDPVSQELLDQLLEAGIRASSSGNMQTYSIVVTQDRALRERLFVPHMEQNMVLDAPVLVTFCADFRRMRKWLRLNEAPDNFGDFFAFMVAAVDAILVSQNVALAAEAEGLGICYMGSTLANADQVGEILELPSGVVPVVGFSLGWPDEDPAPRDRLPLDGLVHSEVYHDQSDDEILNIYADRDQAGWERYMSNPDLRRLIEEADVENLAQIYTVVKYTPEGQAKYSASLLAYLEKQGFMSTLG
ncbi:MAG: NADPH-dependent oxidoreductase [bacterium]|nr:NADPH-dependent oxidoreductase [bacterium]